MDEEAPPSESELQPLWQMAHMTARKKKFLLVVPYQTTISKSKSLLLLAMQLLLKTTIHQNKG